MQGRDVTLTDEEMELYEKMTESKKVTAKRLMWMISATGDDADAQGYREMLSALFDGERYRNKTEAR